MKICFVLGTLQYSGAEKIVRYLINELAKDNYDVSVILLSCTEPYTDIKNVNQIPLFLEKEERGNKLIRVLKRIRRIRNVVEENSFDLVISFGVKFNLDVVHAIKGTKTKLILCERNDPYNDPSSKLLRLRRKITYRYANGFVFQTKKIQKFFSKRIQNNSIVIPNFIETKELNDNYYRPTRKSFVTSARLDIHQKDQITLLKAFAIVNKKYPEYFLDIYGDGPDKRKLEMMSKELGISDNVFFYGRVEKPIEKIKNCEAFVLSSIYEGMPNALIEAMSIGMPCISTDCGGGGAAELIENEENGVLVDIGNEQQLAEAMIKICEDSQYARKIGENAYKINERLEMKKIINVWKEYFEEVIKAK